MSNYKDFFNILKDDYSNFEKPVKLFFKNYSKLAKIITSVTEWVPMDFFILLFLTVITLTIFNAVSNNRKVNFIFSVGISIVSMTLVNKFVLHSYRIQALTKSALLLLVPVFIYYYSVHLTNYLIKYYKKRKLASPGSIERAIFNLQMTYNETMAQAHLLLSDGNYDTTRLKERLNNLKASTNGLLKTINKPEDSDEDETVT